MSKSQPVYLLFQVEFLVFFATSILRERTAHLFCCKLFRRKPSQKSTCCQTWLWFKKCAQKSRKKEVRVSSRLHVISFLFIFDTKMPSTASKGKTKASFSKISHTLLTWLSSFSSGTGFLSRKRSKPPHSSFTSEFKNLRYLHITNKMAVSNKIANTLEVSNTLSKWSSKWMLTDHILVLILCPFFVKITVFSSHCLTCSWPSYLK